MTKVQLNLHDGKSPGIAVYADLARVPVVGDEIQHEDETYMVSVVMFSTNGDTPYVVARVPV